MTKKTVIVTGAGGGIGLACAQGLIKDGHNLTALDVKPIPEVFWDRLDADTEYAAELFKIEEEFYIKAVIGDIDIDQEWVGYVQEWMNAGGRAKTEEANAIYAAK